MSQNIKYTMPQIKRAMIEYSKGVLIETLRALPGGNRLTDKQIMALEDKYEYELDSVATFEEMQEITNLYVKQLRTFAENADIGNSYWQQTDEDILKLQEALKGKFDVVFEYQARVEAEVEQIMQKAIENMEKITGGKDKPKAIENMETITGGKDKQKSIENMETITGGKDKQKSPMVVQIEKQIEAAGGNPTVMTINGQEVIVTQETIVNPKTNELETVYMCRSPKATEMMAVGDDNIAQIGYDGWTLCVTMDEHHTMFPEIAALENDFIAKYDEKSPFDIEETMDAIVQEGQIQSIEEETMEEIAPQNLEKDEEPQVIERDGCKYVVSKEAVYGDNGELITPGELRTLGACSPEELKKGHVVLNQGTYNMVLTLDEYTEMIRAIDVSHTKPHDIETGERDK